MKNQESRSALYPRCAIWIAVGCAVFAPLGCGGDDAEPRKIAGAGGTGGAGGTAGTAGTGGESGGGGDTDASGAVCGGFASLRCPDPNVTYCDFPEKSACGQGDMSGVCAPRPDTCTKDCPGVCGCDGKFYCNACEAHNAGIDDTSIGSCTDASNVGRTP